MTDGDRILTRHSMLEKEMKRIVKVCNSTKLQVSTRADYKIITISYNKQESLQSNPSNLNLPRNPSFHQISPNFKKSAKEPKVDYEKEHLRLERQEKRYKQRDLEKILSLRLKTAKPGSHPHEYVKKLQSDEIYKLEFSSEPSELLGLPTAEELVMRHGIRGIYFENMVVKLRFKRSHPADNIIQSLMDKEERSKIVKRDASQPDEHDGEYDPSSEFPAIKAKLSKSIIEPKVKTKVSVASSKINRSRAFGVPFPPFKRLDLDYSNEHWKILNEMGIF